MMPLFFAFGELPGCINRRVDFAKCPIELISRKDNLSATTTVHYVVAGIFVFDA